MAWSDIRHIRRVTFSGHFKNSTQAKWKTRSGASNWDKQCDLGTDTELIHSSRPNKLSVPGFETRIFSLGLDALIHDPAFDSKKIDRFDCENKFRHSSKSMRRMEISS
jgi:hypothetical protein